MAHGAWLLIILSGYKISLLRMTITYKAKEQGKLDPRIEKIFAPLKDLKHIQVFLHGSWADNSTTAFSDIDDFIIIDDTKLTPSELENLEEILLKVQNEFYRIDPLQHHGHWRVFKSELKDYNNAVIPLFILEDSICLVGANVIEASINHNKTFYTISNSIKSLCVWIDKLFSDYYNNQLNVYNLKRLVGSVVLLAPLINQLKGHKIDKKTAIQNANQLFSDEALSLIKWASDLRTNWDILTEDQKFKDFAWKQNGIPLEKWQKHAEDNAPILNCTSLSDVKPGPELVNTFIKQCIAHLDASTLIEKSIEDYQNAYKIVEEFAINIDAIMVGQFGEIKHPGISDLDVFICLKDEDYKKGQEDIRLFIEHNADLSYVFTHPPVCIAESMLPYLPFVHTINNLKLSYNKESLSLKNSLSANYIATLNTIWTLLILPELAYEAPLTDKTGLRDMLLRLKNAHTSLYNLQVINKENSKALETSRRLRDTVFSDYETTRIKTEKELKEVYQKLSNYKLNSKQKYCIVGRRLLLKEGKYDTFYYKHITILSLPPILYSTLKDYFYKSKKEVNQYIHAFKAMEKISNDLGANMPAVFLLKIYGKIDCPSPQKKLIFKAISLLPYSLVRKIL